MTRINIQKVIFDLLFLVAPVKVSCNTLARSIILSEGLQSLSGAAIQRAGSPDCVVVAPATIASSFFEDSAVRSNSPIRWNECFRM
jgi:hypothetical protein